jgi:hypothetical protein
MPHLNIKINRKSETDPAWPDITDKNFVEELQLDRAGILEKGMTSGRTSVSLALKDSAGGFYIVQTSAAIIDMLYHSIKGAEKHWEENPE